MVTRFLRGKRLTEQWFDPFATEVCDMASLHNQRLERNNKMFKKSGTRDILYISQENKGKVLRRAIRVIL